MAKNITSRESDYSQWYLDVIKAAELADYSPVRGCMVIRPTGYAIWEEIQAKMDKAFKETGHVNAYFPALIPEEFLRREAKHVEGFAPECAMVTHAGGSELEEPYALRPTSETIFGHMYNKWITSWRDLPMLINQWANVFRWEKRTRLFLRTSEFLWQEGHTAHATADEAMEETRRMLEVYRHIMHEEMALPVIDGIKSEGERFPGADETFTVEAMMSDGKALQSGTSHFLGQRFAKAFDIKFQDKDESTQYCWTTSWGVSTRLVGAIIMTHSDNDGLVLPPRIATRKVVLLPIGKGEEAQNKALEECHNLATELRKVLGFTAVHVDQDFDARPADRFFAHLQKGVPLRLELGEKDLAAGTVRAVCRDNGEKIDIPFAEVVTRVPQLLDQIQSRLYEKAKAFRDANIVDVNSYEELQKVLSEGKWGRCYFAGSVEDEKRLKEENQATVRCFPLATLDQRGTCIMTGKADARLALIARSY